MHLSDLRLRLSGRIDLCLECWFCLLSRQTKIKLSKRVPCWLFLLDLGETVHWGDILDFGSWFLLKAEVELAQRCGHKRVSTNSKLSCLTKHSIHIRLLAKQSWLLQQMLEVWSLLGLLLYRLLSREIKCTKVIFSRLLGIHLLLRLQKH